MSRELVLVPKRKYDDLIRKAAERSEDKSSEKDGGGEKDIEHENRQRDNGNQHGYGAENPFTEMTFESFDKLHKKSRPKKSRVKYKWLNFKL